MGGFVLEKGVVFLREKIFFYGFFYYYYGFSVMMMFIVFFFLGFINVFYWKDRILRSEFLLEVYIIVFLILG